MAYEEIKLNNVGCEYGRKLKDMLEAHKQDMCCNFVFCKERINALSDKLEELEGWRMKMDDKILKFETKLAWLMGVSATIGSLLGTTIALLIKHLL